MYGGQRLKQTALLKPTISSYNAMENINICHGAKRCHLQLARQYSQQVRKLSTHGLYANSLHWLLRNKCAWLARQWSLPQCPWTFAKRMGAGAQPRGKLGPLLAEFKHKIMVRSSDATIPKTITEDSGAPFQGLPLQSSSLN